MLISPRSTIYYRSSGTRRLRRGDFAEQDARPLAGGAKTEHAVDGHSPAAALRAATVRSFPPSRAGRSLCEGGTRRHCGPALRGSSCTEYNGNVVVPVGRTC